MEWLAILYWIWILMPYVIGIYCSAQAVGDFRAKRYGWAVAGALFAVVLFVSGFPVQTHAVKVEMPPAVGPN